MSAVEPLFPVEHDRIIPPDFSHGAKSEGPAPSTTTHAQSSEDDYAIHIISEWRKILGTRLLALLALMGGIFMWGYAVFDPMPLRLWAGALYSIGVLWPQVWLHLRKG